MNRDFTLFYLSKHSGVSCFANFHLFNHMHCIYKPVTRLVVHFDHCLYVVQRNCQKSWDFKFQHREIDIFHINVENVI